MHGSPVDVLILGGGVVGLTTARELARAGCRVAVLDRDDLGRQASWAGAGIIPPGHLESARTPYERLRAFSVARMADLSRDLLEATGIDNGYRACGAIEILGDSVDPDEWRSPGIRIRPLDGPGLRRLEPDLAPYWSAGYHLPDMAQVRNPWHLRALIAACEQAGVALHPHTPAESLIRNGDRVDGVMTPKGSIHAGQVLLATGAWTGGLCESVGLRLGVRPIRGQIALLNTGNAGQRPILLEGHRYIVPRGDGRFLVGSSEEDVGFDARTTAEVIAELLRFAGAMVPMLASAGVERCWAGLRPGTRDGLPYLGRVPGWQNLYLAAGHFRAGILLSPGTAVLMTALMTGRTPAVSLDAFAADRA